jgi:hypothetical protein
MAGESEIYFRGSTELAPPDEESPRARAIFRCQKSGGPPGVGREARLRVKLRRAGRRFDANRAATIPHYNGTVKEIVNYKL